ncbi:hypothetical protein QE382_004376 [Sphingobacterium zeae]|uniref:NQR2, RnfD, RnfE family n=1 Tax=Sphingobacterium zeae TaxID=1776859 RepID=A0ABU0UC03_9SPHI|nr:hypothetical protein [Sphingobacterium zeae]MDQ1152392.1 hypothetical protein [Sphingobacterium zeae]
MKKKIDLRVPALIRFASAITVLNIFGHLYLGFEQSYAHVFIALGTAYILDLIFEYISAKLEGKVPAFYGGMKNFIIFLLPAHITAMAVSMLTFTNANFGFLIFGVCVGILSKYLFRVNINGKNKHFLNPSNTGIAILFLVFPQVGPAPPYQFTEITSGYGDWIVVAIILCLGSFLNYKFTKKLPLILAWLGTFALQAVVRTYIFNTSTLAALGVMSGVAFLLFTFYMISDPGTTPFKVKNQIIFGMAVAILYGITVELHIVYNLFFSLFAVCICRGIYFWMIDLKKKSYQKGQITELPKEISNEANVA